MYGTSRVAQSDAWYGVIGTSCTNGDRTEVHQRKRWKSTQDVKYEHIRLAIAEKLLCRRHAVGCGAMLALLGTINC